MSHCKHWCWELVNRVLAICGLKQTYLPQLLRQPRQWEGVLSQNQARVEGRSRQHLAWCISSK